MADAALAAAASTLLTDLQVFLNKLYSSGQMDTVAGMVMIGSNPTVLRPFLDTVEADMVALQTAVTNDPGVP